MKFKFFKIIPQSIFGQIRFRYFALVILPSNHHANDALDDERRFAYFVMMKYMRRITQS